MNDFSMNDIALTNVAAVKDVRDRLGCSIQEAHRIVIRNLLTDALEKAQSLEDLKPVIQQLIIRLTW